MRSLITPWSLIVMCRVVVLALAAAAAGCTTVGELRPESRQPAIYEYARTERVRVLRLLEEHRTIIERRDGERYLLALSTGCLQALPDTVDQPSIPVLVKSPYTFAGAGSWLFFPVKNQGCWIERSTRLDESH